MASSLSKKGSSSSNNNNHNNKGAAAVVYGIPAPRKLRKAFSNFALTAACGFITILVLRGSTVFNEFSMLTMIKTEQGLELSDSSAKRFVTVSRQQQQQPYQLKKQDEEEMTIDLAKVQSAQLLQQQGDETSFMMPNPPPYIFLPRVQNWDKERLRRITKGSSRHLHSHQSSVLLVTGSPPSPCHQSNGDYFRTKFLKNKMDYCRLHDLDIFYNLATLDINLGSGQWSKLPLLHSLMIAHPETEWLWWMDSDSIFTDMSFHLPLEKYKNQNLILSGSKELVYNERSWIGLSTGSFLIRNCQWSLDLLDAWAAMAPQGKIRTEFGALLTKVLKGRPDIEADDQSALIYLLNEQKSKWANRVHFEDPLFFLQEYWSVVDKNDEESIDKMFTASEHHKMPFITHFVGCRPCNIYNKELESCLTSMERAYNFADNQVLQFYGFKHDDLSSYRLRSVSV